MAKQTSTIGATDTGTRLVLGNRDRFRRDFNRACFEFSHSLAFHPLFELPRLVELAKSMPGDDIYFDAGDVKVNQRWDETPRTKLSVEELIDRIENAGAWIIIRRAEHNPDYAEILDRTPAEVTDLVGSAMPKRMKTKAAIIFISSPNRVSTYHIDRECNFLMQIRGEKVISIFDKYDLEVLPQLEVERFWTVDNNAAVYKEQYQDRAKNYELKPGVGVHIPVNAPHWVKNDNNISVTLAATFVFPDSELANIHRANYLLRKVGLKPMSPGLSKIRDRMKSATLGCAITVRNTLGLRKG